MLCGTATTNGRPQSSDVDAVYAQHSLTAGQIRIVNLRNTLKPDALELQIDFETQSASQEAGRYIAISHTWGTEPFDHHVLYRNSVKIPVTKSCWDALNASLWQGLGRRLWIDQLSINQQDYDEKSEQILLMEHIYAEAGVVAVWLGLCEQLEGSGCTPQHREHPGSEDNLDGFQRPHTAPKTPYLPDKDGIHPFNLQHASDAALAQSLDRALLLVLHVAHLIPGENDNQHGTKPQPWDDDTLLLDSCAWNSLLWMIQRPWFSRQWILQESTTSEKCIIWIDRIRMPFRSLLFFMSAGLDDILLQKDPSERMFELAKRLKELQTQAELSCARIRAITHTAEGFVGGNPVRTTLLLSLLYAYRHFEVSDPRDKFYSLFALASDRHALPRPDYKLTNEQVHHQYLQYFIEFNQYPQILTACGLWERTSTGFQHFDESIPTWLPSWFPRSQPSSAGMQTLNIEEDSRFWKGVLKDVRFTGVASSCEPALPSAKPILSQDCLRLSIKLFSLERIVAATPLDFFSPNGLNRAEIIDASRFVIAHTNLDLADPAKPFKSLLFSGQKLCCPAFVGNDFQHDDSCRRHFQDHSIFESALLVLMALAGGRTTESLEMIKLFEPICERIKHGGCLLGHCNYLAATSSGRFAFVPGCVQAEDFAAIVPGLRSPMLLRPMKTSAIPPEMQVVSGSIFFNGVMQGEALDWPDYNLELVTLV